MEVESIREEIKAKGEDDSRVVIAYQLFEGSPVVAATSLLLKKDPAEILFIGPRAHIEILRARMSCLLTVPASEGLGRWVGIMPEKKTRLRLYYQFGERLIDKLELLDYKVRRDLILYCDFRLSAEARLLVCTEERMWDTKVGLPSGLENGGFELPEIGLIVRPEENILVS